MPRIRSIKPEFWTSEQVVECSPMARLLFIGLWNFCDDCGRHPNSPKQMKAEIFPADDISIESVRALVVELSANGLLLTYTIDSKDLLQVTGWHHQRIDKPQPAKYPPPPDLGIPISDHSKNPPGAFPPDTKGEDTKGEEGRGADARATLAKFRREVIALQKRLFPDSMPLDTSLCDVFEAQGFDPRLMLAKIEEVWTRTKQPKALNYFPKIFEELHAKKIDVPQVTPEIEKKFWDRLLDHEAETGKWSSTRITKSDIPAAHIEDWKARRGNPGDLTIPEYLRRTG